LRSPRSSRAQSSGCTSPFRRCWPRHSTRPNVIRHLSIERKRIGAACLGVAGPIRGRRAQLTNRDWAIDADAIAAALDGAPVTLVNDLEAAAMGIDALPERDFAVLQARPAAPAGVRLVIGAGRTRHRLCGLVCGTPSDGGQ
jgi:glucokinase